MFVSDNDGCSGCDSLERLVDRLDTECQRYEIRIEELQEENSRLRDELSELRWMMGELER